MARIQRTLGRSKPIRKAASKYWPLLAILIVFLFVLGGSFAPDELNHAQTRKYSSETAQEHGIDEASQVSVARYTKVLAGVTVAIGVISFFQVYFLIRSDNAARNALAQTQRAFVYMDGFDVDLSTRADTQEAGSLNAILDGRTAGLHVVRFTIQPRWKNSGKTPTRRLRTKTGWETFVGVAPENYKGPRYRTEQNLFLGPQSVERGSVMEVGEMVANSLINSSQASPRELIIWGISEYRDIFSEADHLTEWCYKVEFALTKDSKSICVNFVQWGDHNRSDEDDRP